MCNRHVDNFGEVDSLGCLHNQEPKYYYLNRQNQIISGDLIDSTFQEATAIAPDLIRIKTKKGYGIIKKNGEIFKKPSPSYKYIGHFDRGYAKVKMADKFRYSWLDMNGNILEEKPSN